ncbi:MAG: polyphosphate polymerase domain-containing protein [Ruminiclostridium sp.]|nr:polyphosphate polymerase domain-containing protein [Ruminiclostridium sp.]
MTAENSNPKRYRHEMKYIINSGYYHILRSRLKAAMKPDPHGDDGVYRITSLYFDDIFRTAYNDKLLGLDVRKKYRIRYYSLSSSVIRLEVKEKKGEMVCKRSVPLGYEEYQSILKGRAEFFNKDSFIDTAGEEFYISHNLTALSPAVLVDYIREAYICPAGNVRITFDSSLKTSLHADPLGDSGKDADFINVFNGGEIILEVKYDSFIPSYISDLISGIPLTRESVSKFVLCSDKLTEVSKCSYCQKIS